MAARGRGNPQLGPGGGGPAPRGGGRGNPRGAPRGGGGGPRGGGGGGGGGVPQGGQRGGGAPRGRGGGGGGGGGQRQMFTQQQIQQFQTAVRNACTNPAGQTQTLQQFAPSQKPTVPATTGAISVMYHEYMIKHGAAAQCYNNGRTNRDARMCMASMCYMRAIAYFIIDLRQQERRHVTNPTLIGGRGGNTNAGHDQQIDQWFTTFDRWEDRFRNPAAVQEYQRVLAPGFQGQPANIGSVRHGITNPDSWAEKDSPAHIGTAGTQVGAPDTSTNPAEGGDEGQELPIPPNAKKGYAPSRDSNLTATF